MIDRTKMPCDECARIERAVAYWTNQKDDWFKDLPIRLHNDRETNIRYWDWQMQDLLHKQERHVASCKRRHKGNGTYQGPFAFTLTKSPKDNISQDEMVAAARKIMQQKSCPVTKYAFYVEKAGESHVHIHGMYETFSLGRIEKKHFKRAWPIWGEGDPKLRMGAGFRGGYHRPVRAQEAYTEYIKKDGGFSESNLEE